MAISLGIYPIFRQTQMNFPLNHLFNEFPNKTTPGMGNFCIFLIARGYQHVVIFMLKDYTNVGIGTEVPRRDAGSLMLIDLLLV